jgi:hypothetical protein
MVESMRGVPRAVLGEWIAVGGIDGRMDGWVGGWVGGKEN